MNKDKKPLRTCVVCRSEKEKSDLIRIVKPKDGAVFVDATGKSNGRGAYVCKNAECIEKAEKKKILQRVFSSEIDESLFDSMKEILIATR